MSLSFKSTNVTVDGIRICDRGITVVSRAHNYYNKGQARQYWR